MAYMLPAVSLPIARNLPLLSKLDVSKLNISLFDGSNWATWSWKVSNFFAAASLMSLLDNEKAEPTPEEKTKVNLIFCPNND